MKRVILQYGPCRPKIDFPYTKDGSGVLRKCSIQYYNKTTKSGLSIPRLWLCYSVVLDCVYCETCWLFADRYHGHFKNNWISGICDWHHINYKINIHEISQQHINATILRSHWCKNETIDKHMEEQLLNETKFWKNVLSRIIKIVLFLTAGNTGLRGNEGCKKKSGHITEGNFIRTVKLMADFDPVLSRLLNDGNLKTKYLSWKIQNEIIDLLASELRSTLSTEVRSSIFFSIIADSTQDITKLDQLSLIIRYIVIDYEAKSFEIKETFFGFFELKKHGAADYENSIYKILQSLNLDIQNCRGQGYDGASVMSGIYSGVHQRISSTVSNAPYVHCCAHNLNLVLCDAAKSSNEAANFFENIQAIYNFFSSSAPRWATLAFKEHYGNKIRTKVLKKVCPTRWEARHESLSALKERFIDVLKTLTMISLTSTKSEEKTMSLSLMKKIESFDFVLILCVWEKILRPLHGVSKNLQYQDTDLQKARDQLENAYQSIQKLRENYDSVVEDAKVLCFKWGISTKPKSTRPRFAKKYFDDVDGDRRLQITEDNFRIKVFLPVVDTVLSQLKTRFLGLQNVCSTFDFLRPQSIIESEEKSIIKESYDFVFKYQSDIGSEFTSQLISLKEMIMNKNLKTIGELAIFILQNDFSISYSEVLGACMLFLVLPVTVATAERSFSKLKLIKNFLRNSIAQDRLTNIAILNVEQHRTSELNLQKVINDFANLKARKINFRS